MKLAQTLDPELSALITYSVLRDSKVAKHKTR